MSEAYMYICEVSESKLNRSWHTVYKADCWYMYMCIETQTLINGVR